jgi:virulence-associated protein VagC
MGAVKYAGMLTTTGNSQAIRFPKAFFDAINIEDTKKRVIATILPSGTVLLSFEQPEIDWEEEEAPYLAEFLKFIETEFMEKPTKRLVAVTKDMADEAIRFLERVPEVSDDEELPDDIL